MAADAERKEAGARKRRIRWIVTGVLVFICLAFYLSLYLQVRHKAWVQPHPVVYPPEDQWPSSGPGLVAPANTKFPTNPYDHFTAQAADIFFAPLILAEWVCCKRQVYFEDGSVTNYYEILF